MYLSLSLAPDLLQRVKPPQHLRVPVREQRLGQRRRGRGGGRGRAGGGGRPAQHGGTHPHPSAQFHRHRPQQQWWEPQAGLSLSQVEMEEKEGGGEGEHVCGRRAALIGWLKRYNFSGSILLIFKPH